jgi:hypothetical protein
VDLLAFDTMTPMSFSRPPRIRARQITDADVETAVADWDAKTAAVFRETQSRRIVCCSHHLYSLLTEIIDHRPQRLGPIKLV